MTALLLATTLLSPQEAETKIVAASLFKNGYAVVVREVPMPIAGEVLITDPPKGALGTLWVTATGSLKLTSVVATTIKTETFSDLGSLDVLLSANVGKKLTLFHMVPGVSAPQETTATLKAATGSMIVFEDEKGQSAIQKSTVVRVTSPSGDLVYQAKGESQKSALRVSGSGNGSVRILCLERGLTWVPGYHVDISDPKQLTLTSKATVINDLGVLQGVDAKLITGFPNVRFIGVLDPLTSGLRTDQFVNALLGAGAAAMDASPMTQNAFAGRIAESGGGGGFGGFDPGQLEGEQLEDLFFYSLPNVTLSPGDRGYYVQFQEKAAYEHVYTLDLPDTGWWAGASPGRQMPEPDQEPVWHTLEFTNPSSSPLTTAAATTFMSGQIIGQDMLSYTAPKSKAVLRITKALDVRPEVIEEETGRERDAIPRTAYSPNYDLVSAKGTIQVTNYKREPVTLKVTKQLVGEVTSASHGGTVTKNRAGLKSMNPNSEVRWTIVLKAGEQIELTFDSKLYVQGR